MSPGAGAACSVLVNGRLSDEFGEVRSPAARRAFGPIVALALQVAFALSAPCRAELGMVAEVGSGAVIFEASTGRVVGAVPLAASEAGPAGCSISADQRLGFVTDFASRVWVVEPQTRTLAPGVNPIPIQSAGLDTALTADERFLLVCGGNAGVAGPVSVVDVAARAEVDAYVLDPGESCLSIEACGDGSVLATSATAVHRLVIDEQGRLSHTGEVLEGQFLLQNADCAADGTGVAIRREVAAEIQSFELSGVWPVARRALASRGAIGNTVLLSRPNETLYALTSYGELELFDYDPSGAIGAAARTAVPVGGAGSSMYGIDTMALTADGRKLFVSQLPRTTTREDGEPAVRQPGRLQILNARTGARLGSIARSGASAPRGVCLPRVDTVRVEIGPGPDTPLLSPLSREPLTVVIFGSQEFDVADVDPVTLGFGPDSAEPAEALEFDDADDDGFADLVSRYPMPETGIAFGDTEACVRGERVQGTVFQGCDEIATIGPPVAAGPMVGVGGQPSRSACGVGFELALLLPALMWLRRRQQPGA
jgi:hypothetical protein